MLLLAACHTDSHNSLVVADADSTPALVTGRKSPLAAGPPLFTYEEPPSTLSFWASGAVHIVVAARGGATRTCDSELGETDNMWTRPDVDSAFQAPDVKSALAGKAIYASAYQSAARLVAPEGTIEWWTAFDEAPPPEPAAVHHLHELLHVVLENRVKLCPLDSGTPVPGGH